MYLRDLPLIPKNIHKSMEYPEQILVLIWSFQVQHVAELMQIIVKFEGESSKNINTIIKVGA